MIAFAFDQSVLDACNRAEKIKAELDKKKNLPQNNLNMKNIRFVTAVLLAVGEVRKAPFSVFNVTQLLRQQVNGGQLAFTDKSLEDVDGINTYKVEHSEVKEVFNELERNNVVTGLASRPNKGYIEYYPSVKSDVPAIPTSSVSGVVPSDGKQLTAQDIKAATQASPKVTITVNADRLNKINKMFPTVVPNSALPNALKQLVAPTVNQPVSKPTVVASLPTDASLKNRLQDYLAGRQASNVFMKEIQSRFKGVQLTCEQYANLVNQIGFVVDKSNQYPSKWSVAV